VLYAVARLTIGVAGEPLAPAQALALDGDLGHVDGVAMLEVHVALVDGLKAGTASGGDQRAWDERAEGLHPSHALVYIEAMFTGLVAVTGALASRTLRGPGARLVLRASFDDGPLVLGESIAVDGVCLSVDAIVDGGFEVDASAETLARTTLGRLPVESPVHFERSVRVGDPLGGHLVTGHVDGVGTVSGRRDVGEALWMAVSLEPSLARFVAEKGSIAVDGVSLTVNAAGPSSFEVTLIPQTLKKTKLGQHSAGAAVNLEVDLVARYVARLMSLSP
jgi:riboflavin synthase